jgi:DNA (cytosine-5)-methyltransferase 1
MRRNLIPVVSLFSGAGGMDLGFRKEGFIPIFAIDSDQASVDSYNWNNKGAVARHGDLLELSDAEIIALIRQVAPGVQPRGIIGGPPCQSFSVSNVHRKLRDPRRALPLRYAQIISAINKEFKLDFFVFENVTGLKSNKHRRALSKFLKAFKEAGFDVFEEALNASTLGVPQNRSRVFIVGINRRLYPNAQFEFPKGNTKKVVTVRNAIGGLPDPVFFKREIEPKDIPYHPNHWTMNPKSHKFTNGSNKSGRSFRKLKWDKPSWTVAYGHREIHVHPNGSRRVSIFEAMLLQGFPRRYELRGNFTEQVEQVSNAVPPPMASAIARAIRKVVYSRIEKIQTKLLDWFKTNKRSFPWRQTKVPYKILLAEKLLQQTAATEQVVAAYEKIVRLYPTLESLSKASVAELKHIIAPLGFSYRANELPRLAQEILNLHQGEIPAELDKLLRLPGIGDYAARAILSFAHGQDAPIVDTNIARLLYRIFGITNQMPSNPARNKKLIEMATALVPEGQSRDFNLAALDLCASICTARQPNCAICPIRNECVYGKTAGKARKPKVAK